MNEQRPPLILVPGLICNHRLWSAQCSGLAALAEVTVTDEHTRHDNVGDVAAAVLAAAPARFALAGLSFGGYIALEIMRRAPGRVDRLALLDTRAQADGEAVRRKRELLIEQSKVGRFLGVTDTLLESFIHPARLGDRALVAEIKAMAREVGRDGFIRQQTAIMNRPDARDGLAAIACPTLVLVGRQDALTPLADHQAMAAALPNAKLAVIEDCGHLSTMERPEAVNAALRAWLRL